MMKYTSALHYHFKPQKGWVNDPNGLVYYKGYYHIFYQHNPNSEACADPMHWGHARTKDFLEWEELPVALFPDQVYDNNGCWSGTAMVKNDILYVLYTSIHTPQESKEKIQTISLAYSTDGIHFEKHPNNPLICNNPVDDSPDFRDPAMCCIDGTYYCVIASGNTEELEARLLLYRSEDLVDWDYQGIMGQWQGCKFTECPSLVPAGDKYLLTVSVCPPEGLGYLEVMCGRFENGKFFVEHTSQIEKGPDQYAAQVFQDHRGRNILITWLPGWCYGTVFRDRNIGCMSIPRELKLQDGRVYAEPVEELSHLFQTEDPVVQRTETGFVVERQGRTPVVYEGKINDIRILRDEYLVEIFLNHGSEVYSILL